jgi:hypothetical protein
VGKPSTNGFSAVGSKSLVLRRVNPKLKLSNGSSIPFAYIVGDIVTHRGWVVSDDQTLDGEVSLCSFSKHDDIRIEAGLDVRKVCTVLPDPACIYNIQPVWPDEQSIWRLEMK